MGPATAAGILLLLFAVTVPAAAKILKTVQQPTESAEHVLIVGSGLDFHSDSDETEYDFPFLLEYGFSENVKCSVEPNYILLNRKHERSERGFGELETSVSWDALDEENKRPGLSLLGLIKWPTASSRELGTGETDYTLGLSAGKEFSRWNSDLNLLYTFVGSPPGVALQNSLEIILSGEWSCSEMFSLMAEIGTIDGAGRSHGQSGTIQGLAGREEGSERSLTFGVAEHLGEVVKLEEGCTVLSDGSWQVVLGWEFAIGGGGDD
jgi:hypothetical protein